MIRKTIHLICLLLGFTLAELEFGYQLIQDEQVNQYFLPVYVGSHALRKNLLLDIMANGTIINYDPENSSNSVAHFSNE